VTICIFVGPTLRREEVAAVCDATCLPPVAQGDVYRAAQQRPRAIGIIDGFFSGAPSVWHKEILWALSQGIPVFGSASMGALRAAELHQFGMRGIGRIFEAYRDGILEDDDEVAVVHGPAELGFLPVSEAMVNIRATLARAEGEGILSGPARRGLESFGKSLYFPERDWPTLLAAIGKSGISEADLNALLDWLPHGRVDQKRVDALAMLSAITDDLAHPQSLDPDFAFEWTHFWDELVTRSAPGVSTASTPHRDVVEELRLQGPDSYERVRSRALLRFFAGIEAKRRGQEASPEAMRAVLGRLRASLGLFTRLALDAWLNRNDLDAASLEHLIADSVHANAAAELPGDALDRYLLDELRINGAYERLAARARQKRQTLSVDASDGGEHMPSPAALRLWFCQRCLNSEMPEDMEAFARALGFAQLADHDGALRREWLYLRAVEGKISGTSSD
jgi:hypothetical protein